MVYANYGTCGPSLLRPYARAYAYRGLRAFASLSIARSDGEDDPTVAICHSNLGGAWHSLDDYQKAFEYCELALASDLKTFGEDHPQCG